MSRSTHQAIAGAESAASRTHALCRDAVRRYGEVRSEKDLADVYTWAKRQAWFFRSALDESEKREADAQARKRIALSATIDALFHVLPSRDREAAMEILEMMRGGPGDIVDAIEMMLGGNYPAEIVRVAELAQWVDLNYRGNRAGQFMHRIVRGRLRMAEDVGRAAAITRAAFAMLPSDGQKRLAAMIADTIAANRAEFYESFPKFRPAATEAAPLGGEFLAEPGPEGAGQSSDEPARA